MQSATRAGRLVGATTRSGNVYRLANTVGYQYAGRLRLGANVEQQVLHLHSGKWISSGNNTFGSS